MVAQKVIINLTPKEKSVCVPYIELGIIQPPYTPLFTYSSVDRTLFNAPIFLSHASTFP